MSATTHTAARPWARVHQAAIAIVVLSLGLAACLGLLLATRVSAGPAPLPVPSVSHLDEQPIDNGCQFAHPGQPC